MSPIIEIKNVTFSFNTKKAEKTNENVLENVNLKIYENEFIGIVGPNGGGKTTLVKLVLSLLKPNSGQISIFNKSASSQKTKIGYVPQFLSFSKDFPIKVRDVILMGSKSLKNYFFSYSKEDLLKANEIIDFLKIRNLENNLIGTLSGGELQKTLIARALISNAKILILDEPSSSTDPSISKDIFDLLKKLNKNITIIVVSHDIGFISHYIDRVICVNKKAIEHTTAHLSKEKLEDLYQDKVKIIPHSKGGCYD
jgi:zinc transport system ATP-binding protein